MPRGRALPKPRRVMPASCCANRSPVINPADIPAAVNREESAGLSCGANPHFLAGKLSPSDPSPGVSAHSRPGSAGTGKPSELTPRSPGEQLGTSKGIWDTALPSLALLLSPGHSGLSRLGDKIPAEYLLGLLFALREMCQVVQNPKKPTLPPPRGWLNTDKI